MFYWHVTSEVRHEAPRKSLASNLLMFSMSFPRTLLASHLTMQQRPPTRVVQVFLFYNPRLVQDDVHSGSLASDLIVVQNWYPKGSSASDIVQHKYLASELEVSHG